MLLESRLEQDKKIQHIYKENTKTLFKVYYVLILFFLIYATIGNISSFDLRSKYSYYESLQLAIIILIYISIILEFLTIYLLKTKQLSHILFFSLYVLKAIMYSPTVIQLVSFLLGVFDKYCDFSIRHEGTVNASYITYNLEKYYPTCSQMSSAGDVQTQIYGYSQLIIINFCKYSENILNCTQLDTLQVDNWSNMFVLQIVSYCLSQIWILSAIVILLFLKVKHVQATQRVNEEAKNNQQNQIQQQYQQISQQQYVQPYNNQIQNQQPYYQNNQPNQNNQFAYLPPDQYIQNPQFVEKNQDFYLQKPLNS